MPMTTTGTRSLIPQDLPQRPPKEFPNILTVDLEDWFHICEVETILPRSIWDSLPSTVAADTELLLDLLGRTGARATFFVLGYVARRHPSLIRRINDLGHEIAYHGWDHELVYQLRPEGFRSILRDGIHLIEDLIGARPIGFRAPQWSINDRSPWALEVLAEEGFLYDSSMAPLKFIGNEAYPSEPHFRSTSHGPLWEVPPLTLWTPWGRFPAAGGWGLRSLPLPVLARVVNRLNRRSSPAVFYVHPREIGSNRSIQGLPLSKRFVLNGGLWSTLSRIKGILRAFRFSSVACHIAASGASAC
ncbi:MAG: polysaccharide deacetylase family protein [Syntrophobacteraceae bacterium]